MASPKPTAPPTTDDTIYRLKFIKANLMDFTLCTFPGAKDMTEIVERAKDHCARNNLRFMFVEPAIVEIKKGD